MPALKIVHVFMGFYSRLGSACFTNSWLFMVSQWEWNIFTKVLEKETDERHARQVRHTDFWKICAPCLEIPLTCLIWFGVECVALLTNWTVGSRVKQLVEWGAAISRYSKFGPNNFQQQIWGTKIAISHLLGTKSEIPVKFLGFCFTQLVCRCRGFWPKFQYFETTVITKTPGRTFLLECSWCHGKTGPLW